MKKQNRKFVATVGALTLGLITGTSALADDVTAAERNGAGVPAMTGTLLPTEIDNPSVPADPDGTCEMCWGDVMKNSASDAELEIYFEDDGEDFSGDLELTMTLTNQTTELLVISSTEIRHQETTTYYSLSPGSSWDWDDVTEVSVEAVLPPE